MSRALERRLRQLEVAAGKRKPVRRITTELDDLDIAKRVLLGLELAGRPGASDALKDLAVSMAVRLKLIDSQPAT